MIAPCGHGFDTIHRYVPVLFNILPYLADIVPKKIKDILTCLFGMIYMSMLLGILPSRIIRKKV
jgi:hypothetical protein